MFYSKLLQTYFVMKIIHLFGYFIDQLVIYLLWNYAVMISKRSLK